MGMKRRQLLGNLQSRKNRCLTFEATFLASFDDEHTTGYIKLKENATNKLSPLTELKNYRKYKGIDA